MFDYSFILPQNEYGCEILQHYFENHGNVAKCMRLDFGRREAPSTPYVRYLVEKVKKTGILFDKAKPKTVHTCENVCVKRHQHQFTIVLNKH